MCARTIFLRHILDTCEFLRHIIDGRLVLLSGGNSFSSSIWNEAFFFARLKTARICWLLNQMRGTYLISSFGYPFLFILDREIHPRFFNCYFDRIYPKLVRKVKKKKVGFEELPDGRL